MDNIEIVNSFMDFDDDEQQQEIVETTNMLMTKVGGKDFAIPFENVVKLCQAGDIYSVPEFPDYVLGFTKVDEDNFPVIDARRRFGMPPKEDLDRSCIVVTQEDGVKVGILVDEAVKMRVTPVDAVTPAEKINDEAYTRYVKGMFRRTGGSLCYVLSPKLMYSLTSGSFHAAAKYRLRKKK